MTRPSAARTASARTGHARAIEVRHDLARSIREARRDAGLSARTVAIAAGVTTDTVLDLEAATRDHGIEVVARVTAALGGRLRLWVEPGSGPAIHDRSQAAMLGALIRMANPAWTRTPEVSVVEPVRGVIDLVLDRSSPSDVIAVESESRLTRIEQQVRWASAKAEALAEARAAEGARGTVSRLLLLRSTTETRRIVATYPDVIGAAYPARIVDALEALTGSAPWPGPALVWCLTSGTTATLLDAPPRGIRLGR